MGARNVKPIIYMQSGPGRDMQSDTEAIQHHTSAEFIEKMDLHSHSVHTSNVLGFDGIAIAVTCDVIGLQFVVTQIVNIALASVL